MTISDTPGEGLAELIAEMRAGLDGVTPGPWQVYDGCSWRRIGTAHGGRDDCAVLAPTKASDGHPDLTCSSGNDRDANLAHIARCSPENIRALLDAIPSVASDTAPTVDGKAVEALTRARDAFLIYAKSAEGHHATKYELAGDLRIQAGLIDAALAALASAKRFKTGE